jgi:hypothetical protein
MNDQLSTGLPEYPPFNIIDYNSRTDGIYLEDKVYQDINGQWKYVKILKFTSTNPEIVKILRDCYDNEVFITVDKKQMLVINKDNMWEYINLIKKNKADDDKRYYTVDIKNNKSSNEDWEYVKGLQEKMIKPISWDNFDDLKPLFESITKWEKKNKRYNETGKLS